MKTETITCDFCDDQMDRRGYDVVRLTREIDFKKTNIEIEVLVNLDFEDVCSECRQDLREFIQDFFDDQH